MSDQAMAGHRELLKSRHCGRIMSDVQMLAFGIPMTKETLVGRWIGEVGLTTEHLNAARCAVATAFHPDHHGGSGVAMQMANAAIDQAITELDALAEADARARRTIDV